MYSFITPNFRESDYPLDLWLRYNVNIFDEVAVIKYGDFDLPFEDRKIVSESVSAPENDSWEFYRKGKKRAQELLKTDWKVLLDIDEFVDKRIRFELDESLAYPLTYRHLFGNLYTEIRDNRFPRTAPRLHYGNREIMGDGGSVSGPRSKRPVACFWHTGAARNPVALSRKWAIQIEREKKEGYMKNEERLKFLEQPFDYSNYKTVWPNSYLVRVDRNEIPDILRENESRFAWCEFDEALAEGSLIERYLAFRAFVGRMIKRGFRLGSMISPWHTSASRNDRSARG